MGRFLSLSWTSVNISVEYISTRCSWSRSLYLSPCSLNKPLGGRLPLSVLYPHSFGMSAKTGSVRRILSIITSHHYRPHYTLGGGGEVPTLDAGGGTYLGWGRAPTLEGEGVPTLDGEGGVPTLEGGKDTYPGQVMPRAVRLLPLPAGLCFDHSHYRNYTHSHYRNYTHYISNPVIHISVTKFLVSGINQVIKDLWLIQTELEWGLQRHKSAYMILCKNFHTNSSRT